MKITSQNEENLINKDAAKVKFIVSNSDQTCAMIFEHSHSKLIQLTQALALLGTAC